MGCPQSEGQSREARHLVRISQAAFRDPFALEFLDDRFDYGEERFILIAMLDGLCLTVVDAPRGDVCRLISAYPSNKAEQDAYFEAQD